MIANTHGRTFSEFDALRFSVWAQGSHSGHFMVVGADGTPLSGMVPTEPGKAGMAVFVAREWRESL